MKNYDEWVKLVSEDYDYISDYYVRKKAGNRGVLMPFLSTFDFTNHEIYVKNKTEVIKLSSILDSLYLNYNLLHSGLYKYFNDYTKKEKRELGLL